MDIKEVRELKKHLLETIAKLDEIEKQEKVLLIIDNWSSRCGACGKGAFPEDTHHIRAAGYTVKQPNTEGCGKKFTHVTSYYVSTQRDIRAELEKQRPDLIVEYTNPVLR